MTCDMSVQLWYNVSDPYVCLTYSELESHNGQGYIDYMDEMEGICSQEFQEMGRVGTNMHMNVFNSILWSTISPLWRHQIKITIIGGHRDICDNSWEKMPIKHANHYLSNPLATENQRNFYEI